RTARSLKIGFVLIEVGPKIGVRDRFRRRRVDDWRKQDKACLSAVMLVLPRAPELSVADVRSGRDLIEQLLARNFRPIILLELQEQPTLSRLRAPEQPLVLLRVEPAVGL